MLTSAKPAIVICTRDRTRATAFYRDTLGLMLAHEDQFAAAFIVSGVTLRVSTVPDFTPHEHTIVGFSIHRRVRTHRLLAVRFQQVSPSGVMSSIVGRIP
jgi:hypothetical protein